jgi:hypothetical protein
MAGGAGGEPMNSLFGVDLPTPVNFVIAFVVVLLLIGAIAWLVRRFGAARLDAGARSRQPRLAVVDAAAIDSRRKLVIIRRDNAEHLLMIGGPTDVVVETNIVRATPLATPARNGAEPTLRAVPEPAPTQWQPEPAAAAAPTVRSAPRVVADDIWQNDEAAALHAMQQAQSVPPAGYAPPVRPVRPAETLASLANELSRPAVEPRVMPPEAAPPMVAPAPAPAAPVPQPSPADQSLAEMAQRLEAALRRPTAQKVVAEPATPRVAAAADNKAPARPPRVVVAATTASPKGGTQPAAAPQPNNLEQEMASLLNKPGKT